MQQIKGGETPSADPGGGTDDSLGTAIATPRSIGPRSIGHARPARACLGSHPPLRGGFLHMNGSRLRRRSLRAGISVPLSVVLLLLVALVHPGLALPGSSFEGTDGNLVVDTAGNPDWANAPNRVRGD